ncbi:AMP-binding protein [Paenibacillus sp. 481]|nr:AMP-binding protein [Paenibacillus sp. 481]
MQAYEGIEHFQHVEGKLFALCLTDPLQIVTLVLYLRDHHASVLLIHGETPQETAQQLALEARCEGLVYGQPEHFYSLRDQVSREAGRGIAGMESTANTNGNGNADADVDASVSPSNSEPFEPSIYQFSSGTTGNAKLIRRSWAAVRTEMEAYNRTLDTDETETPIVLAPVTHSYGLLCGVLASLERGSTPIIVTNKNPKFALSLIRETPRHLVYGVPLLFHVITSFSQGQTRFHKLMSSGVPLPQALFTKLSAVTDVMMQQYGCSEVGCISVCNQMQTHTDLGQALPHLTVATGADETQPGEIVVTNGNQEVRTGDLGYRTDTGHIRFLSRLDDVINVSGLKVYPLEVEEVILQMDGIREAIVYRGQHPVMGEIAKCKVIIEPTAVAEEVTPDRIRDWCMTHLPPYKVPAHIEHTTDIPKNATGKVSRKRMELGDVTS